MGWGGELKWVTEKNEKERDYSDGMNLKINE